MRQIKSKQTEQSEKRIAGMTLAELRAAYKERGVVRTKATAGSSWFGWKVTVFFQDGTCREAEGVDIIEGLAVALGGAA